MRLLVTGDRNWRNARRIREILACYYLPLDDEWTLIEGEAMGADIITAVVFELLAGDLYELYGVDPGWEIERYPAEWNRLGPSAGPIRNKQMLDAKPDLCVAFHDDITRSKGTRDMLRHCAEAGIPGRLFTQWEEVKEWEKLVLN